MRTIQLASKIGKCLCAVFCYHLTNQQRKHQNNHFTALFPGPPGWASARRELLDFMTQGKMNRGRHTNHPDGRHSIWTNQCPPPPSPQLRHVWTIGKKKLVKQQYLLHISSQYGELWPTSGWDRIVSLEHPSKFQQLSRLGSVTARHSNSRHQPNFVVLNIVRHLY